MIQTWMQSINIFRPVLVGSQLYDTAGTYQWTCPEGVTKVSCVLVSPGQNALWSFTGSIQYAGAGGGLRYRNDIPVVPGQVYTIVVGAGAQTAKNDNDAPCTAFGISVSSGSRGTAIAGNVFGGYGGEGANGSSGSFNTGGSRGGNSATYTNGTTSPGNRPTLGGGTGINILTGSVVASVGTAGGIYGGGGGNVSGSGPGGKGAVYIIWGPGRSFPNNIAVAP